MPRRPLAADVGEVRALPAEGVADLEAAVGGSGDYWLRSARERLRDVDRLLVIAVSAPRPWVRASANVAVAGVAVLVATGGLKASGVDGGWLIAAAVIVSMASFVLAYRFEIRSGPPPTWEDDAASAGVLKEMPEGLPRARARLVSAILRQARPDRWRPAPLVALVKSSMRMSALQEADLLLCQAIDHLETHLREYRS